MNLFSGKIEVENYDKNEVGDKGSFIIYFHGIPSAACIDLATQNWGGSVNDGLIYVASRKNRNNGFTTDVHVGCKGVKSEREVVACVGGSNVSMPMTVDNVADMCKNENTLLQLKFF